MNTLCQTAETVTVSPLRRWLPKRPEILVFATLLIVFSGAMLFGSAIGTTIFQPEAVRGGEWWRVLTHPFVHVTWYHLLLDASAFFLLYNGLSKSAFRDGLLTCWRVARAACCYRGWQHQRSRPTDSADSHASHTD